MSWKNNIYQVSKLFFQLDNEVKLIKPILL